MKHITYVKERNAVGNQSRMKGRLGRENVKGLRGHLSMGPNKDWARETKSQYIIKEQVSCNLSRSRRDLP
jgi:hypothetical protein